MRVRNAAPERLHTHPGTQLDECTVTTVACTKMHLQLPGKCILVLCEDFTKGLGRMCSNYCIHQPYECTVTTVACTKLHLQQPGKCILVLWEDFTEGSGRMCSNYCIQQPDESTVTTVACTKMHLQQPGKCILAFWSPGRTSQRDWGKSAVTTVSCSQTKVL